MTQRTGMIRVNTTFLRERMGLTKKRPSYRPTGTHPSLRFVSEWRLANGLTLLSSTNRPILCTHWSPTGNTVPPHWVVARGRRWLVRRLLYSSIVTEKASTLWVLTSSDLKQELVSLLTKKTTAEAVIPESGLAQEEPRVTPIPVEMRLQPAQITGPEKSKQWDISWYNERNVAITQRNRVWTHLS